VDVVDGRALNLGKSSGTNTVVQSATREQRLKGECPQSPYLTLALKKQQRQNKKNAGDLALPT